MDVNNPNDVNEEEPPMVEGDEVEQLPEPLVRIVTERTGSRDELRRMLRDMQQELVNAQGNLLNVIDEVQALRRKDRLALEYRYDEQWIGAALNFVGLALNNVGLARIAMRKRKKVAPPDEMEERVDPPKVPKASSAEESAG